jgi:hypothetical protein
MQESFQVMHCGIDGERGSEELVAAIVVVMAVLVRRGKDK